MPLTSEKAREIAPDNWKKRRANETDKWAKDARERIRRDYQTYIRHVAQKFSMAHILQEREFAGVIAALIYLPSRYLEINGSMAGYKKVPQHILEETAGVDLTQFRQLSKGYLGLFWCNYRNRIEEGEDRWDITTKLQDYFDEFGEMSFLQVASELGAEVRIPKEWDEICARDYQNWKRSDSPNLLVSPLLPDIAKAEEKDDSES